MGKCQRYRFLGFSSHKLQLNLSRTGFTAKDKYKTSQLKLGVFE